MNDSIKPDSNLLFAIDAAVIAIVSVAISLFADKLTLMTVLVPLVIVGRMIAVATVASGEQVNLRAELVFLTICTAFGAFNDWNSVCNKQIYDYTVPHYFDFSTIPIWMLLFWGMILRFVARFARWQALVPPTAIENRIGIGKYYIENGKVKVLAQLALVLITRQAIYRMYLDPIWSWLPFLFALIIYMLFFKPQRHDFILIAIFMIGGPAIESLYIKVGELHYYHLGWLGGVPLWIALWWLVIILIWKDLAYRIENRLVRAFSNRMSPMN
jgi:hypothetical protein